MVSPSKYDVVLGDKVPVYLVDDVIESQVKDRKANNITVSRHITCNIKLPYNVYVKVFMYKYSCKSIPSYNM